MSNNSETKDLGKVVPIKRGTFKPLRVNRAIARPGYLFPCCCKAPGGCSQLLPLSYFCEVLQSPIRIKAVPVAAGQFRAAPGGVAAP